MTSPQVSILIAARNESANVLDCLRAVEALRYPKDKLQILVGNDHSEDDTAAIVADFVTDKPHFQLFDIHYQVHQLKGKANVLAQLADYATGEILLFTDADISVLPDWVQNMVQAFESNVGVVTGITAVRSGGLFGWLQGLEWLYYLSLMRLVSLFGVPVTAMGNNMAVSRKAYDKVGGYERIGFSLTEDYALFDAIVRHKFDFVQLFDARVLAISKPTLTYAQLLIQRKRWMHGALSLPLQHQLGIWVNALLLPVLLILLIFMPNIAIGLAVAHYVGVTAWSVGLLQWVKAFWLLWVVPVFWFYHVFTNFAMLINHFLVKKTVWKGRQYP